MSQLTEQKVVPDVIDSAPTEIVKVVYPGPVEVHQGIELTPTLVKEQPSVSWAVSDGGLYTICMTDPDAPSRKNPLYREWHHWLIVNIPLSNIKEGEVLSEYIGAGPPEGTGLHRYVFLVYKQPGRLSCDEQRLSNRSGENRGKFSIRNFAAKYNLGDPIAANFFVAKWDTYVPELYKQLSGK